MKQTNILKADQLTVQFDKTPVLWDISLDLPEGKLVAIVGPNGAGKSTLLKAALKIVPPFSGSIQFAHKSIVSYVPQRESVDWNFPITAYELVLMGRYGNLKLFRGPKQADFEAADRALKTLGMQAYKKRQIGELSGGQRQRLFIARALARDPQVLLLDEPFAGIDVVTEKILIDLFKALQKEGKSIIIVHHDLTTVEKYYDWIIMLNTRLIANGPVREVFHPDNIQKTYGNHPSLLDEVQTLNQQISTGIVKR